MAPDSKTLPPPRHRGGAAAGGARDAYLLRQRDCPAWHAEVEQGCSAAAAPLQARRAAMLQAEVEAGPCFTVMLLAKTFQGA